MAKAIFREYYPDKVLSELLSFSVYDKEQGCFIRTARRSGPRTEIGERVGVLSNGYLEIALLGFPFKVSQLIWLVEHGNWCHTDLDHKDGVTTNNHISNLRPASTALNGRNARMRSHNTTGYTGVYFHFGKYFSRVTVDRKVYYCGSYNTPEEAYEARQALIAAHPEWGFTERHGL